MIKRFVIKGFSKKFKGTQKLPAQLTDKFSSADKFSYDPKAKSIFMRRPEIGSQLRQEAAAKFARGVEAKKLESGLKKVRKAAIKQFAGTQFYTKKPGIVRNIYNPKTKTLSRHAASGDPFVFAKKTAVGKRTIARIDKAKTQAIKTARAAGLRALQKRSEEFGVGIKRYGSQKSKFVQKLTDEEARELGFPPREVFKSGKKTAMTDIDKAIDQYSRVEKFDIKTGRYKTFRTYNVKPINPVESFYRKKRRK